MEKNENPQRQRSSSGKKGSRTASGTVSGRSSSSRSKPFSGSSQRAQNSSVHGIHSFRWAPAGTSVANSRASDGKTGKAPAKYIGRLPCSVLCVFLPVLTTTVFVITFSLYLALTVYGPSMLTLYRGDAALAGYSSIWCESFACQQTTANNGTELQEVLEASELAPRRRSVVWPDVVLTQDNNGHLLDLPVSDEAEVVFDAGVGGVCTDVSVLVFASMAKYEAWQTTARSEWLSRESVSCAGRQWLLDTVDGGELVVALFANHLSGSEETTVSLNATVKSQAIDVNASAMLLVCRDLNVLCRVSLTFRSHAKYAISTASGLGQSARAAASPGGSAGLVSRFKCSCSSRSGLYVAVFGGTNLAVILLIATACVVRRWKSRRARDKTASQSKHRDDGAGSGSQPSDATVTARAPTTNDGETERLLEGRDGDRFDTVYTRISIDV